MVTFSINQPPHDFALSIHTHIHTLLHRLQANTRIRGRHIVEQLLGILADERLLVVAGHIMPGNAIIVHIIQHRQARFARLIDVVLGVVWLRHLLVSGLAPRIVTPALWQAIRRLDLFTCRRPEPTEDVLRLQIGAALAALKIAQPSGRPDVRHIVRLDQTEDQVVLLLCFESDQIHAVFAAQVTRIQPVDLATGQCRHVTAKEQILATIVELLWTCCKCRRKSGSVRFNGIYVITSC